jgi:hypothetical protein
LDALASLLPDAGDREIYVRRRLWWASKDYLAFVWMGHRLHRSQPWRWLRLLVLFETDPSKQVERGELLR